MNLVIIGVVCLALIGVACLYFGKDGAIISTIIALIAGAAGFGVNKAKQELAPGDVQIPIVKNNIETKAVSLVSYSVPVKSPMTVGGEFIDFNKIDKEIVESICSLGLDECSIITIVSLGEETPYCFVLKGFPLFLYIRVWFLSHQETLSYLN